MTEEEVIAQIEAAFADTPSPGSGFNDISATQWDEGIVDYFRGKTWQEHRVQDLLRYSAALSFFTDKAYRYWLPAFMLAELAHPEDADIIGEHIAFDFTKSGFSAARLGQFAPNELRAIAAFFDVLAQSCSGELNDGRFRSAACSVRAELEMT